MRTRERQLEDGDTRIIERFVLYGCLPVAGDPNAKHREWETTWFERRGIIQQYRRNPFDQPHWESVCWAQEAQ